MENIEETEEKEDTGKSWDLVQIPKLLSQHDRHILQITRDTEVIQSFVRAGSDTESEDEEPTTDRIEVKRFAKKPPSPAPPEAAKAPRTTKGGGGPIDGQDDGKGKEKKQEEGKWSSHAQKATFVQLTRDLKKRRRGRRVRREEVYTDKDRAAAVNLGNKDIKQSLKAKKKMDRCKLLAIPEEADVSSVLAHGEHEMKFGNVEVGFKIINKALELEPEDKNALVARSKCYLMLGQPHLALRDAETVLSMDKKFIRGIYQKAEALYHLGDFEHSLLFYHRGHKIRPELEGFRLGVQKAQEAIENSIGRNVFPERYDQIQLPTTVSSDEQGRESFRMLTRAGTVISEDDEERRTARRLLGELCVDKNYLEQLIRNPDIKVINKDSGNKISEEAQEAITFLKGRQEFWRQRQKLKQKKK